MSKIFLRHTLTKKKISLLYLYTFSLYENASLIIFSAETEYMSFSKKCTPCGLDKVELMVFIMRVGIVPTGGEHLHDRIISL
jgi:hypothetical protein